MMPLVRLPELNAKRSCVSSLGELPVKFMSSTSCPASGVPFAFEKPKSPSRETARPPSSPMPPTNESGTKSRPTAATSAGSSAEWRRWAAAEEGKHRQDRLPDEKRRIVVPGTAHRIEHRLRRIEEAEAVGPAVPFGTAVLVLPRDADAVRRIVGRPGAALVLAVLGVHQLALQRVIGRRKADPVRVAEAPRHRLDVFCGSLALPSFARRMAPSQMPLPVAPSKAGRATPGRCTPNGRIAARIFAAARVKDVLAERDVLAGDVVLVHAAAVVAPDDAGVGRRALRPVDPVVLDVDLLGRMIAGGQPRDEWS